jgi:4-amino-4-deoxy-L-arabinose transferase-like glycosyltransferase
VKSTEATPPLYYLLTWGFGKLFGVDSDAGLRATSAIAGAGCAPLAFAALRRMTGVRAALASSAVVAASPMLVWYALDARAYSLLVLLSLASLWALSLLLERATNGRYAAWAVACAAAVWTHYFAAFLVTAELVVLLWRLPARRRSTLAAAAGAALLSAPLVWVISAQSDARTDHIGALPLGERLGQAGRQLAMGPNVPRAWLEVAGLALATGGVVAGLWIARREPGLRTVAAVLGIAIAVPLLLSVADVADRLLARNLLIAVPCFAALAGAGLIRLRAVPLALLLAASVATVVWIEADWRYQNADWRGAARALPARASGELVAVLPNLDRQVAQLYLDRRYSTNRLTGSTWAMIAPARVRRRDLRPVAIGPHVPPGFARGETRTHRGFRLVELRALPGAAAPPPAALGRDLLGNVPLLLVPPR